MDMITVKQAAEKWGVTPRRVQGLCKEGKLKGVVRWERTWMIPADAEYPTGDTAPKPVGNAIPRRCPSLMITDLYHTPGTADAVIESLSENPQAAAIFAAEIAYNRFELDRVSEYAQILLDSKQEFQAAVASGFQLALCAAYDGNMRLLLNARRHLFEAPCETDTDRDIVDFWLCVVDFMIGETNLPKWFEKGRFEFIPVDSFPVVKFQYAKFQYLRVRQLLLSKDPKQKAEGKILLAAMPYFLEPMISQAIFDRTLLAEIALRLLVAIVYHDLHNDEEAIHHIDTAITLAIPDRVFTMMIEFRPMLDNLLDERLALISPEALKAVKAGSKKMKEAQIRLYNELTQIQRYDLSVRERQAAKLAAFGMSNAEIAKRMHVSENSIRSMLSMAMNKTGAENRKELGQHL